MTETSISQLSTPLAELRPLPEVVEDTICQDDVVSRHWRKPVSSLNTKDRLTVAEKAIDFMLMLKTVVFNNQASMMNSAVAIFDKLVNRKGRELDSKVQLPVDKHPHSLWYSMEMIYNYRAYKAPLKLYICREEWNKFIPADQKVLNPNLGFVCSSTSPLTASGSTVCDAGQGNFKPVEGAFYDFTGAPAYFEARSGKTILFMTLSSYLAHHTKDPRILQIAIQCAICIKTRMLDSATMLIKDCALDNNGNAKAAGTLSCYLTGIAVEGFSVLASVSGDLAWNRLAVDIAESAMRARDWHGDDGVLTVGTDDTPDINEDSKAFKGLLSRGLLVVYQRNSSDQALRTMIRRYINVQFNALRELASHGNSYGVDWRGPYVGPFPHAQVAALDTLVAAIGVNSS
ncbi:hypothetical protein FRC03_012781 [Tulasnella sp. 419]|nr:hypothetical protein FRC03_012781 [Tulasnella sp. 419]